MKPAVPPSFPNRTSHLLSASESQRLRELLDRSQPLIDFLQAYRQQSLSATETKTVQKLLDALEGEHEPLTWVSNPSLAAGLPLVIRFERLATLSESDIRETMTHLVEYSRVKPALWRTLGYPIFMGFIVLVFILILGFAVIPTLGEVYQDFGLTLPAATRVLTGFSELLRQKPLLTFIGALGTMILITSSFALVSLLFHRLQFIPTIGYWVSGSRRNVQAMSCWSSVLAELLDIDFELSHAIRIAAIACRSHYLSYLSEALSREMDFVTLGTKSQLNPRLVAALPATVALAIFASPTPSISLLRQIATANRVRFEERQERFGGLLGPFTTIAIGLFVGFVVLALFLPLLKMITALSQW